jgi:hypothetical protein
MTLKEPIIARASPATTLTIQNRCYSVNLNLSCNTTNFPKYPNTSWSTPDKAEQGVQVRSACIRRKTIIPYHGILLDALGDNKYPEVEAGFVICAHDRESGVEKMSGAK